MANDTVLCQGCGITLRPFMQRCPRCGAERQATAPTPPRAGTAPAPRPIPTHFVAESPVPEKPSPPPPPPSVKPSVIAVDDVRRRALMQEAPLPPSRPPQDAIFASPPDEVRRFPLFTRSQIVLMLVGLGLVLFGLLIGYLLWSREQRDAASLRGSQGLPPPSLPAVAPPSVAPPLDLNETPTPTLSVDDQVLTEEARKVLAAYNPSGFARYKIVVKDGVVTLDGEAAHQPEKDGATNVLRLLANAKSVVNNLVVKGDVGFAAASASQPTLTPTPTPTHTSPPPTEASLNPPATSAAPAQPAPALLEAQRLQQQENERLQRELAAARQREADLQRQRELEDIARRQQEEARRAVTAAVPSQPAPSRAAVETRSGTIAWSGVVEGIDEIVVSGGSAVVRHVNGAPVREARASFSAAVPRAPVSIKLLANSGRGSIQIVQEPAAANGYTTIVRIDDSSHHGASPYQFTLRWAQQ